MNMYNLSNYFIINTKLNNGYDIKLIKIKRMIKIVIPTKAVVEANASLKNVMWKMTIWSSSCY